MRRLPRQRRSRETVAAILEATRQLVEEAGPLTTDAIATRAGVSIGTLYQYFDDKADVVHALAAAHVEDTVARFRGLAPEGTTRPDLEAYARGLLLAAVEGHDGARRLHGTLAQTGVPAAVADRVAAFESEARRALARVAARVRDRTPAEAEAVGGMAFDLVERFAHKRVAPGASKIELSRAVDAYARQLVALLVGET